MGLLLHKIQDPRDNLEKARRRELYDHAVANKIPGVSRDMPATLLRKRLREAGLTSLVVSAKPLGADDHAVTRPPGSVLLDGKTGRPRSARTPPPTEVDADADLERQYRESRPKTFDEMTGNELRKECTSRGIKMSRKDTAGTLRAKLRGENAS